MKKIQSLFQREDAPSGKQSLVVPIVTPGCEWALRRDEPWCATRKLDGTAVLIQNGVLYARYDAKAGKTPPESAIPCQPSPDPLTGHWPHWVKATRPEDRWIRAALEEVDKFKRAELSSLKFEPDRYAPRIADLEGCFAVLGHAVNDGTFEACGPMIQGNPERYDVHVLVRHGNTGWFETDMPALTFDGVKAFLAEREIEGLVWHHTDGRRCKIKRRDFGLAWPVAGPLRSPYPMSL